MHTLDFRSDTVTQPSAEMRAAMASAEVGDDVLERDPTLDRLERRVAELLGVEAGLWTPTGCMANLIALMLHLQRGDRFLASTHSHVLGGELGTAAWLAGGMPEALPWEGGPGKLTPFQVWKAVGNPGAYYNLRTTLLCLENTHNAAGGTCLSVTEHQALVEAARGRNLRIHLDGARLWHAAAAQNTSLASLAAGVDSVSVCLSKGLGAPMGSVLCGSRAFVEEARRTRKMLGGGVRQGGIMGAAGLTALNHLPRLSEDHAKAQQLAEGLRALGFLNPLPETNILMVPVPDAPSAVDLLEEHGVRVLAAGPYLRFITHQDLGAQAVGEALARIAPLTAKLLNANRPPV